MSCKGLRCLIFFTIHLAIFVFPQNFKYQNLVSYLKSGIKFNNNFIGGVNSSLKPEYVSKAEKYDFYVSNKTELKNAINKAKNGDKIFIYGNSTIDLTNEKTIIIDKSISIVSDRGSKNSLGALVVSRSRPRPLFKISSHNVKIYGLRIDGNDYDDLPAGADVKNYKGKIAYIKPVSEGIIIMADNVEIYNCEIYGWSHAALFVGKNSNNVYIHNNYIHNNRRKGLGYGVALDGGSALIEANLFNNNRHDISGTGISGTSYSATNNIVIADKDDHAFDMHGGKDRNDKTNIAGTIINIKNNRFFMREGARAFVIRGIPTNVATFEDNTIYNLSAQVQSRSLKSNLQNEKLLQNIVGQRNDFGNLKVENNKVLRIK